MNITPRRVVLFFTLIALLSLVACGSNSPTTPSTTAAQISNIPLGHENDPEPGTDGKPRYQPYGHTESTVIANGIAYIGSDNYSLYAFGLRDGTLHWQHQLADTCNVYTVVNGSVYVTVDNTLLALDANDGRLLWQYKGENTISQVQVADSIVYASTAATGNHPTLVALHTTDGSQAWTYTSTAATPNLLGAVNGTVYLVQSQGDPLEASHITLYALQASNGQTLWHTALTDSDGIASGNPIEANGLLYIATAYGGIDTLNPTTGTIIWHAARSVQPSIHVASTSSPTVVNGIIYSADIQRNGQGVSAYHASDGTLLWHYQSASIEPLHFSIPPVVVDGIVYYTNFHAPLVALDATDGHVLWQHQESAPVDRPITVTDGLVVSVSPVFALHSNNGSLAWQSSVSGSGESSDAGPPVLLGEGVVLIGGEDDSVQALDVRSGTQLWHYHIPARPVPTDPVYAAWIHFGSAVSYQQALDSVTNLGLKTFADCAFTWKPQGEQDTYPTSHTLVVAATVNSAPLWFDRLQAMHNIVELQPWGPHSCPLQRADNNSRYLSKEQAGTFVQVTFAENISYEQALTEVNNLGLRLANPCYEQARAQGNKPTWHPMEQTKTFSNHMLLLATTSYNALTWKAQLQATPGVTNINTPFQANC